MTHWRPDPTFYPSPKMAMKAPHETFAYVASFDPSRQVPDAIAVVDVDPASGTFSRIVGNVVMPEVGDELHHFGWNACSSCLCPNAPHPHAERRYLVVPGLRSSRIYILDTKADPRHPENRPCAGTGRSRRKSRLYPTAYGALRTRRHLCRRARQRTGRGAGRHLPDGPRKLRYPGPLGNRPRAPAVVVRRMVASRTRHDGHERMGPAGDLRERSGA